MLFFWNYFFLIRPIKLNTFNTCKKSWKKNLSNATLSLRSRSPFYNCPLTQSLSFNLSLKLHKRECLINNLYWIKQHKVTSYRSYTNIKCSFRIQWYWKAHSTLPSKTFIRHKSCLFRMCSNIQGSIRFLSSCWCRQIIANCQSCDLYNTNRWKILMWIGCNCFITLV